MRRRGPSPVTVLVIASLGAAVAFVDATIVNIAFPNIAKSFPGTSISSLSWILNAYNIVFAAFLVAAGRIADLVGRRRMFIFGLELFTAASLLCAVAPSVGLLVAFRVVQALGAAFLVPASLALVLNAFPPERRAHGVALLSAVAAAAAGLGPSLGGLLVAASDWRLVFLVNLPIGLAAIALARRRLIESRTPGRRRMPDVLGALLFALAVASLVLGVVKGQEWGWGSPRIVATFAVAVVFGAVFIRRCAHHRSPIIDLTLLRIRTFTAANAATIVVAAGFYGYTLTNVLFLTGVWRYSVLQAGLALTPGPFIAAAVAGPTSRLVQRVGPRPVLVVGGLFWGAAVLWFVHRAGLTPHFLTVWLPGMVLLGIGARSQLRHRDRSQLGRAAGRSGARSGHRRRDRRHALAAPGRIRAQGRMDLRRAQPHGRRAGVPAGQPPAQRAGAPSGSCRPGGSR
jgi:NTE family protein